MPLTKANTNNAIRGRIVPNADQRTDCQDVIAFVDGSCLTEGEVRHSFDRWIVAETIHRVLGSV